METHATTKKSLMGRLKNLVHKDKAGKAEHNLPKAIEETVTQSPAPNEVPEVMGTIHEVSDAEVTARLQDVKDAFGGDAPKTASDDEGHVHTAACKHSHKAKPAKSKKMRDLFPGYEGQKFTPKSPSKASIEQKRQKKARRLARLGRK